MTGPDDGERRCVLYVFDSLRYDRVGAGVTPTIDRVAADGVSFENAYSQAIWTYPSAASIFSGLYPETHGSQQFDEPLEAAFPHLADDVGEDVTTACFSTTLGVSPERGFERDFDEFHHIGTGRNALRPDIMDRLNDRLLPWVDRHADGSFLAVVWAMGTHHPYVTSDDVDDPSEPIESDPDVPGSVAWLQRQPREDAGAVAECYDRAVRYSDARFGDLVERLRARDVYDDTTVVVTADHGELFDEHARLEHVPSPVCGALRTALGRRRARELSLFEPSAWLGHQTVLPYDELVHVPLVVKPGDRSGLPSTSDALVELVDIYPTVRDVLGAPVSGACQGRALYDTLSRPDPERFAHSTSQVHKGNLTYRSVRSPDHKLCRRAWSRPDLDRMRSALVAKLTALHLLPPREVLLSSEEEGREERVANQERRAELSDRMTVHRRHCDHARERREAGADRINVDEETTEHLADLGYR